MLVAGRKDKHDPVGRRDGRHDADSDIERGGLVDRSTRFELAELAAGFDPKGFDELLARAAIA